MEAWELSILYDQKHKCYPAAHKKKLPAAPSKSPAYLKALPETKLMSSAVNGPNFSPFHRIKAHAKSRSGMPTERGNRSKQALCYYLRN